MPTRRIFLVRHAHSEKNLEDRHGGEGRGVTEKGFLELQGLANFLRKEAEINSITIFSSPIAQAEISAQYLANQFNTPFQTDDRLRSLNLGVLGGLSRQEAAELHPEPAQRLESWRKGQLGLYELNIPGAEDPDKFWSRGYSFLKEQLMVDEHNRDQVIVGTRSILILLMNILLKETSLKGKPYSLFEFDNCGTSTLEYIGTLKANLISHNQTNY